MGRVCNEVNTWVEQQVQKPVETFVNELRTTCVAQTCNWKCLCCNKWLCWTAWVIVRVVTWVFVTVGAWVLNVVCKFVNLILDAVAFVVNLILCIPLLGGYLRTILNLATETIWRLVGIVDFVLTWAGVQLPKKMYVHLIILNSKGTALTTEAAVLPSITEAQDIYKTECNVNLIYTGACVPRLETPYKALTVPCSLAGFFADWWVNGSYYQFVTTTCVFEDGFRRLIGYGAELVVFIVQEVAGAVGCSMGPTQNYITVDDSAGGFKAIAHELGHACGLVHRDDPNNLMTEKAQIANPKLTNFQRAIVRNSRHCVFI